MLTKTALLSLFVIGAALAQSTTTPPPPPDPPACLTAPVVKGTVTLSCTAFDAFNGDVSSRLVVAAYIFGIKAVSSDPDVVGLRIEVSGVSGKWSGADSIISKQSLTIMRDATGGFTFTFLLMPSYSANGQLIPTIITGITAQELKASSSQAF